MSKSLNIKKYKLYKRIYYEYKMNAGAGAFFSKEYQKLHDNSEKISENYFKYDNNIEKELQKDTIQRDSILFPFLFQLISFSYIQCGDNEAYLNNIFNEEDINYYNLQVNDNCCLVIVYKNTAFIIFRGTKNFNNVLNDLNIYKKDIFLIEEKNKLKTGKLHSGFYIIYDVFEPSLIKLLNTYKEQIEKVVIIGHSLGGALSNIAITFLKNIFKDFKFLSISFSSPLFCDRDYFNNYYDDDLKKYMYQIFNGSDLITTNPTAFYNFYDDIIVNTFNFEINLKSINNTNNNPITQALVYHSNFVFDYNKDVIYNLD